MGILRDDPRLFPLIDTLKTIRKKTFSSLYGIDNIKLDFPQFSRQIAVVEMKGSYSWFSGLLSRALSSFLRLSRASLLFLSSLHLLKTLQKYMKSKQSDRFYTSFHNYNSRCLSNTSGKPADYIPQLARADTTKWGVSLCTIDGQRFSVGDVNDYFSIQSTR